MLVTQEKAAVSLSSRNVLPLSRLLNHGKHKSRGEGGALEKPRTERMLTIVKHSSKKMWKPRRQVSVDCLIYQGTDTN